MFRTIVAIGAAVIVAFGAGFLAAEGMDGRLFWRGGPAAKTGEAWAFFGHPRAASAPRQGEVKPAGFAIWSTRLDTSGPDPAACIRMTRPLDSARAYADFVVVAPDMGHAPAVAARGDELCIGGVGFTDRHVTLLKGLPAADGETLADNQETDVTNGDKPPYVGFAGNGVVLPREESDGIGIQTINVSKLQVEVWRVVDRNLVRKSISAPDPTPEGHYDGEYGDDSPDDEGSIVWKGFVSVHGAPDQRSTTVFPLGAVLKEMKPGGYVVKARDASGGRDIAERAGSSDEEVAQARRWVIFTDMALTAYSGADALDVVVRSLKTARTIPGAPVALMAKDGETLASATTDSSGRATFAHRLLEGDGALSAKMVMAYGPQSDLAVLDLESSPADLSKQGAAATPGSADSLTAGRAATQGVDGYLYTDRGIYRPGETVRLVSLVRDRDSKAMPDRRGMLVVKRPSGLEFQRYPFASAPDGALARDVVLPRDAPRGHWTATLQIEGLKEPAGKVGFEVQDFAPQRLAVTVGGQPQAPVGAGDVRSIDVAARFLYGAIGAGLQTQGEARLRADANPFPAFDGYHWGDDQKPFEEKEVDLPATVTDGAGHAALALAGSAGGDTPDPITALVTASVFEPGGRPVRESVTLRLRPKPLYLGDKVQVADASEGQPAATAIDVVAVDAAGGRTAAAGVGWTLISENWNYDWFQQDGRWQWRRTSRDKVAAAGTLDVGAGAPARIRPRRLDWGDYRLELTGPNGARTVTRFSVGWGSPASGSEAPDLVRLAAGKKAFSQGDDVEIQIKAPYAGEAQVAVATDRLIDFRTFSLGAGGGSVRLKTSAAWGGGAYVLVTVIQPRDPVATPAPRRALGLLYVPLDPRGRKLVVDIGTPPLIDSRAFIDVALRVEGLSWGQTAHLTLAAVDEGILRLTKAASPDPVGWYFGKRALAVDYRDDYGRLLNPNLGAPANVDFGGDEIGGEGLTVTPIKTVALWSGVVTTGSDGRAHVRLPAADFNGQLRLMAVAWTSAQVGSGEAELTVREPVVADLDLPRFLSPGDHAFATLELQNLGGAAGLYHAALRTAGGLLASFEKLFNLPLGQRFAQLIAIAAPSRTGVAQVGFVVTGPRFATQKSYPIEVRLGWGAVTRTTTELQRAGEAYTPPAALLGGLAAGSNGSLQVQVSYSPFRGFDPAPIAASLDGYPYGCTEQVVSAAYPWLYARSLSADPLLRHAPAALSEAVGRLLDRQSLDGAFGLWRVGDGEADPWLGAYATDFLIEARAAGAAVPQSAIDAALNAMRQVSLPDSSSEVGYQMSFPDTWAGSAAASKAATLRMRSRASAYALYVLAKGGRGDLARLRWWHDVQMKSEGSPLAMAQVGAGLAMMGDRARARDAFAHAAAALGYRRPLLWLGPLVFLDSADWYQSPLRDLAGVIALAYEAGDQDAARGLETRLEGSVRDPDDLNTQEKAQLLRAAHFMLQAVGPVNVQATGAIVPLGAGGAAPRWAVNGRLATTRFVNAGTRPLWRTVTVKGTPIDSPAPDAHGLQVQKTFFTFSGAAADPAAIRQGDRLIVRIAGASHEGRTVALAVNDALPAGYEIESMLGPDDAEKGPFKFLGSLTQPKAQESRDDRYVAALDLAGGKSFVLAYVVRAVTPGDFYLPGVEALDMYHAGVNARTAGARTRISPLG